MLNFLEKVAGMSFNDGKHKVYVKVTERDAIRVDFEVEFNKIQNMSLDSGTDWQAIHITPGNLTAVFGCQMLLRGIESPYIFGQSDFCMGAYESYKTTYTKFKRFFDAGFKRERVNSSFVFDPIFGEQPVEDYLSKLANIIVSDHGAILFNVLYLLESPIGWHNTKPYTLSNGYITTSHSNVDFNRSYYRGMNQTGSLAGMMMIASKLDKLEELSDKVDELLILQIDLIEG